MTADAAAVVVAAGAGLRLGRGNKALLPLAGRPLLVYSLRALQASPSVAEIILVMNQEDARLLSERWSLRLEDYGVLRVVAGGPARWLSSYNGCRASSPRLPLLLVHDAARPGVTPEIVEAVCEAIRGHGAALAACPVADTLKRAGSDGQVQETVPREGLWLAQTPQGARRDWLLAAFAAWPAAAPAPTDEAALLEACGHRPYLVAAPASNGKVTTAADLLVAEALLLSATAPRPDHGA